MSIEKPSINNQAEEFDKKQQLEKEEVLENLLAEVETDSKELSDTEKTFLKDQLNRIEEELSKTREPEEQGVEYDNLVNQSRRIKNILEEQK